MRTTSIKETLEKHSPKTTENVEKTEQQQIVNEEEQRAESPTYSSTEQRPVESAEENNTLPLSKEYWDECVRDSCELSKIAEILLLKVDPSPTDNYKIEFEVASEVEKNEIKQIQASLLQKLREKTGNLYSLEMQITKIIREKTVDKTNPDEKFIHLCKENPHLLEFKQRLNLSIS